MNVAEANEPLATGIAVTIALKRLSKVQVPKAAGYNKQQFSDMLNGRKIIKPCDALAIAEALNVTMNDLYEAGTKGRERMENWKL